VISDLAIMALRGVTVPIHHTLPSNQIQYILRDSGARILLVENQAQLGKLEDLAASCPALERIVLIDPVATAGPSCTDYTTLVERGRMRRERESGFLARALEAVDADAPCSIVYTSGTTAEPKGVILRHRGFVTVVLSSETVLGLRSDDVFLSFLPLSHLYERLAGHWCALYRGCTIAYARDLTRVLEDLTQVRPTVMVSVPRIYEKLRSRVDERAANSGWITRRLFEWGIRTGLAYHTARLGRGAGAALAARHAVAQRIVFRQIRKRLGGRFRHPISGGAPLSADTLRFFQALGLHLVEGYGMTETHLIITLTPPGGTRPGSCGIPIPGVEVGLAADGEILVRGPTVMLGYHNKPEETRQVLDESGWLHTGDIGSFDDDGYLHITDRKKDLIVTAGGKKVAPAPIENDLRSSPLIDEVCLTGDGRKFIAALVVPNFAALERWATERRLVGLDRLALTAHPEVVERIMDEIRARQSAYAGHEQVKKCVVLAEPFSLERGELTPSLKVRRRVVQEHYREELERLYS
jgi:long-chain acyl-CoA synthetase